MSEMSGIFMEKTAYWCKKLSYYSCHFASEICFRIESWAQVLWLWL